jgi:SDR family mycofactocin-dependent oxidoreductase
MDDALPLAGRVALITGAGRGQGRSHAVALARLGADVAVCDICADLPAAGYGLATPEDLLETARLVEDAGRRTLHAVVDVRDLDAVTAFTDKTVDKLGSVDIAVANAGICAIVGVDAMTAEQWHEVVDTNLTGTFNVIRAVTPHMKSRRFGRIVGVSSMLGRQGAPFVSAYSTSKWGIIGLCKSAAAELGGDGITVNVVAPGNVATPMIHNEQLYALMRPDLEHPTADDVASPMASLHVQPVPWLEPEEITDAVVFLVCETGRHISGSVIDIDAGAAARFTG